MSEELLNTILAALGIIITALASWAGEALVSLIKQKIQDKKIANLLAKITMVITDTVQAIYQEFVETLKEEGKFDEEAQETAKRKAVEIIEAQLTIAMREFIAENFGDLELWINQKIESVIYELKAKYSHKNEE